MWLKTLRGKLTVWNLCVLSLTLLLFGIVLNLSNQKRISEDIDRQLRDQARRVAMSPPPPSPNAIPGPFGEGQGVGGRPPDIENRPDENADMDPLAVLRRPQHFDLDGRIMGNPYVKPIDAKLIKPALEGQIRYSTIPFEDTRARVIAAPKYGNGQIIGAVEVARDLRDFDALWSAQAITLLIMLPLAILVAGLGALFLTNKALRPVGQLTESAQAITASDLSSRLPVQGEDEFAHLARTINGMISRLDVSFGDLSKALTSAEAAFENQRRFTADASHELRTPLTRLKLALGEAAHAESIEGVHKPIEVADKAADVMSKLVQQLLLLSRADAGELRFMKQPIDLRVVAAEAVDGISTHGHKLTTDFCPQPVVVCGDEDHLRRVFTNLVENAIRYSPQDGEITVGVGIEGDFAMARVADHGCGISSDHLPNVFDRFYRVDASRARSDGGCGLGLAICKSIVDAHNGTIQVQSVPEQGTTVTFSLPLQKM